MEVGALKPDNYRSCSSWIETTSIDLHSRHPSIIEQDFLLLDAEEHREKWDIVSLSLVLNFVPEAKDRGTFFKPYAILSALTELRDSSHAPPRLPNSDTEWLSFSRSEDVSLSLVGGINYPYGQLPLACVANSRYLDFDHLKALMETIGFREVQQRWRPGGKMAYWLYRKELPLNGVVEQFQKKVVLRQGNIRNNFSILL